MWLLLQLLLQAWCLCATGCVYGLVYFNTWPTLGCVVTFKLFSSFLLSLSLWSSIICRTTNCGINIHWGLFYGYHFFHSVVIFFFWIYFFYRVRDSNICVHDFFFFLCYSLNFDYNNVVSEYEVEKNLSGLWLMLGRVLNLIESPHTRYVYLVWFLGIYIKQKLKWMFN